MNRKPFGKMPDGREVFSYLLTNRRGVSVSVINYGAIVQSLVVPDKDGALEDVVLGFDSLAPYLSSNPYFGAVVGRFGNRIAGGKFTLNGTAYDLETNNGDNHLHGGRMGFDKKYWEMEAVEVDSGAAVRARLESPDGDGGYPGAVVLDVVIHLDDENALRFEYRGTTDKPTILNPTQHSYFNLSGDPSRPISEHRLQIGADTITPVDSTLIPTGELMPVGGTPFDFREATEVGRRIDDDSEQLAIAGGYDHNFVLNDFEPGVVRKVAEVRDEGSGRVMSVSTDQPGMQLYTGNFLDGTLKGKGGVVYPKRCALCLETQHYPDSPNQPDFPSVTLNPGDTYRQETIYRFSIE